MKKITTLFISLFLLWACGSTNSGNKGQLTFDPNIQHGKLENGLQYFILKNTEPKDRIYIRLVVNAGSMNEDNDQKGIAHLVEHMAFNGSQKYPENQIINALEKLGMKFARDINAFTDFENTVYTLNLSQNDNQKIELAFDVLNEWMNNLTILQKDLDAERGIVQEEWRRRLSPMLRLGDKKSAIEMAGSRYILRDPIGDMNIIRNISRQRVADFYQKWYRPDNMSVVIVGDIQPNQVLDLLKQKLSGKSPRQNQPIEKIDFNIPLQQHWRLATVSEAEINTPSIELSFLQDFKEKNTVAEYKQDLIQQMVIRLINLRLQKWEDKNKNIDSANFYHSHLGRQTLQSVFALQLFKPEYQQDIEQLFNFIAELKQNGFSQSELESELDRLAKLNEKQRNIKSGSLRLADDLIIVAATNQLSLSQEDKYYLNKRFLNEINLQDLNNTFQKLIEIKARLLLITQPYPQKSLPFKQEDIEKLWNKVIHSSHHQWQQNEQHSKMPELNINVGGIKQVKYWQQGDITEYQLSNGSKLIYHYSDKTPNQVYFKADVKGGLRSIPMQDYHLLRSAVTLVDDTGIGSLPLADVNQLFGQSGMVLATVIDDYRQGFTGVAKPKELGDLFKLFRLKLQSSPISDIALEKYKREAEEYFKQIDKETEFMRAISKLRYPNYATVYNQNKAQILNANKDQLSKLYENYILNNTDFTYFIVGDISQFEVEKLAKQYLASVEIKQKNTQAYPLNITTPAQPFIMQGLKEPRADVEIYLTTNNNWNAEEQYVLDILGDIVQEKLRLILREQEAGIYSVNSWFSQDPEMPQIEGKIEFSCAPERAQKLIDLTHQILDDIAQNGIEQDLLNKKIAEKHIQIKQQFDSLISVVSLIEESFWQANSPQNIYLYQRLEQIASKQNVDAMAKKALAKSGRFESRLTH